MNFYEAFRHESQGYSAGTEDGNYIYHEQLGWVLKPGFSYTDQKEEDRTEENQD